MLVQLIWLCLNCLFVALWFGLLGSCFCFLLYVLFIWRDFVYFVYTLRYFCLFILSGIVCCLCVLFIWVVDLLLVGLVGGNMVIRLVLLVIWVCLRSGVELLFRCGCLILCWFCYFWVFELIFQIWIWASDVWIWYKA